MKKESEKSLHAIIEAAGTTSSSKLRRRIGIGAVVLVVLCVLVRTGMAGDKPPMPSFETIPLARGEISLVVTATGNLEPTDEVTVGSELSGTVLEVYVDTNSIVHKGDPLAKLDTSILEQEILSSRANLLSAKASVAQAKATQVEADATLARARKLRELSDGRLPSQADFDSATATALRAAADLQAAEAKVSVAEATLSINERDLEKAIIISPIDGIVLSREIEPGQTVAASFTAPELFVIAQSLEHMKLTVTVAEADIGRLQEGQEASFTVDAWPGRVYQADVLKVAYGSTVTDNVVTYETEMGVENSDMSLRPGMTATADIKAASSENTYIVPTTALRFKPQAQEGTAAPQKKSFLQSIVPMPPRVRQPGHSNGQNSKRLKSGSSRIWVLMDGIPQPIMVKTGLSEGANIEIIGEGLSDGMQIIIREK
ncbi:MAG: efflux RND transporter periplasmic adaptor subunit [Opitutales bacterium]|nr:efflux RND transporter periplasmic adaptor subunit [Opitutales bacterium]